MHGDDDVKNETLRFSMKLTTIVKMSVAHSLVTLNLRENDVTAPWTRVCRNDVVVHLFNHRRRHRVPHFVVHVVQYF